MPWELTLLLVTESAKERKSAQEMCFIIQVKKSLLLDLLIVHLIFPVCEFSNQPALSFSMESLYLRGF